MIDRKFRPRLLKAAGLLCIACMTAAGPATAQSGATTVRPGAPGEPSRTVQLEPPAERERPALTASDVQFMKGMLPHHAQALDMTALVPDRTERRDVRLLAERIEVAQGDEIAWMQRWLKDHGAEAPNLQAPHAHHGEGHHALMPGMLTPDEMARLAAAQGPDFDRLFLEFMIRHHEGALVMVRQLLASPGAAQTPEVYRFASDVDADQQADIRRMRRMLDETPGLASPSPHHH